MNSGFRNLFNTTGKVILVIALALNICMVFLGLWPSLVYVLLVLLGAGVIYVTRRGTLGSRVYAGTKKVVKIALVVFAGIIVIVALLFYFGENYFKKRDTMNEGKEMVQALNQYKANTGSYPASLSVLTSGNPLRAGWLSDEWGTPYKYSATKNGNSYLLISAGADGKFGTGDDVGLW